jgi:GMP synthase-like glutamine amidotransferase
MKREPEPIRTRPRVAIVDNAIHPRIYKPVEHWSAYLRGVEWESFYAPSGRLPAVQDFSHFILTGSEASILQREPWADREVEFTREAFRAGRSILGSCYGHQLLALALAGPAHVGRCREPEIGWIPIEIKASSSVLGPPGEAFTFSVHFDEVRDLADPFVVLAATEVCPVQAFGVRGRNVWGFQIHPEIDVVSARGILSEFGSIFPKIQPLYARALSEKPRDSGLIFKIVKEFLAISS